ncbi:hypothetical protein ACFE04_029716 [Oxalis oulophora]
MYQSKDGKYDLHPCCANLDHTITTTIDQEEEVYLSLRKSAHSKCLKCKMKEVSHQVKGWCYASSSGGYCYHVACVKAIVLEDWKKNRLNNNNKNNNLALMRIAPSREVTRSNEGTSSSCTGKKALKYIKKATLILRAVVSAIFGDPIHLFVLLAEQFISN